MTNNELRESVKKYIEQIYLSHRITDIEAWNHLVDTILDYVDISIKEYDEKHTSKILEMLKKYIDKRFEEIKSDITK